MIPISDWPADRTPDKDQEAVKIASATAVTAAALILLLAPPAPAQEVRVGVVQAWPDHELLGSPLGVSLAVEDEIIDRVGLRIGVEASGDDFRSLGSTCVGLVPPGMDCSAEPREERARIRSIALSVPLSVASTRWIGLRLVPGLRTTWLDSDQTGLESGRTRTAEKSMYGYEIGAEATMPIDAWPLQIHLSGAIGELRPYREDLLVDGYSPFEDAVGFRWLQLGVSLLP